MAASRRLRAPIPTSANCARCTSCPPCAAKARNLGLAQACGEFVLYLDGDTELHPAFPGHALRALADGQLCAAWGAVRHDAGPRGHLNAESGLGDWPEGLDLIRPWQSSTMTAW